MLGFTRLFDPLNLTGLDRGAQNEANARADAYRDAAPRPDNIKWNSVYDPSTMAMAPGIEHSLSGINLDKSGLNQFQNEAMRKGPSEWANRASAQQEGLSKNALDMGARSVAGQGAAARASLATRGGLTGGAAERVATEGQNNFLNMAQGVNQQKASNLQQIGMNDEQNRMQMLGQVPGMQLQASQFDLSKLGMQGQAQQFDIGNQMANNQSKNAFDLGQYNSQMQAWGAGQTAAATQQAGKHKK